MVSLHSFLFLMRYRMQIFLVWPLYWIVREPTTFEISRKSYGNTEGKTKKMNPIFTFTNRVCPRGSSSTIHEAHYPRRRWNVPWPTQRQPGFPTLWMVAPKPSSPSTCHQPTVNPSPRQYPGHRPPPLERATSAITSARWRSVILTHAGGILGNT